MKTEGERVMELLTSMFYDIKSFKFKLIGLNVVEQQNGNHKIEFIIENNEELIEKEIEKERQELEAVKEDPLERVSE